DGDRHLSLDLLRGLSRVERDHHHLDVGHVGEGLDLELREGVNPEQHEAHGDHEDRDAPSNGEIDQPVEHKRPLPARQAAMRTTAVKKTPRIASRPDARSPSVTHATKIAMSATSAAFAATCSSSSGLGGGCSCLRYGVISSGGDAGRAAITVP